uniref:Reverse transcriptase domain-containing protein n=1 Tax=Tanacetum cinerariifolium TaxID=118510 RepID=A0A6L2JN34_TANCI|nr:reverse transcriptase domain-containing protein [Tanacetum cinerariifolium]
MEELCQPSINRRGGLIAPIPIQATDFGLRHHMIQQVQNTCQFHGLPGDDANRHIDKFLEITQHMKQNGVSDDTLHLSLFPYSLTHHAMAWYDRLLRNSIHSFDDMMWKFLSKYFPPSMVTKLRNEITKFKQKPHKSLFEAWERYKLSIDWCPNHNMLLVTQIDTFYNGLILSHLDTINAAPGGTFMKKTSKECYKLIENITAHHNHWDTSAIRDETSRNTSSTSTTESPEEDLKAITTRSGVTLAGPSVSPPPPSKEPSPASTSSTPISSPKMSEVTKNTPKPTIPYPSRANKQKLREKDDNLALKFVEIFRNPHFELSFTDALLHMPKFALMFKSLLNNKEKLFDLATNPVNENCSAIILKKLPKKLRDPGKFLIPCDFPELDECLALTDLGASINLMPLSIWRKLSLTELTTTQMILELADRSTTRPAGIAKDFFVKVGKFHFLTDLVVDYVVDPRVPLILGRPFLRTRRALIDVYGEELTLRVDDEAITFKVGQTLKYSYNDVKSINRIDVIDVACEEYVQEMDFPDIFRFRLTQKTKKRLPSLALIERLLTDVCLLVYVMLQARSKDKMLKRCKDTNLVLNLEKCHFMVKEGIILDHKISKSEIEVDRAKVDVIAKLPHSTSVKGAENLAADHLSRLENPHQDELEKNEIIETFPLESLGMIAFRGDLSTPCSRLKIFLGKLKTRWTGPFIVAHVFSYGTIELSQADGPNFKDSLDCEDSRACGFVHRPLDLQSLAYGNSIS